MSKGQFKLIMGGQHAVPIRRHASTRPYSTYYFETANENSNLGYAMLGRASTYERAQIAAHRQLLDHDYKRAEIYDESGKRVGQAKRRYNEITIKKF